MLKRSDFHLYQEVSLKHMLDSEHTSVYNDTPNSGNFLEMGLGKTCVTLTAVDILLLSSMINKPLVVGPLRVCQSVWAQEAAKWEHLKHLTFSHVLGDQVQRGNALRKKADVYIINRENIPWLQAYYATAWPFDMVVLDESSSFKDPSAKRSRSLKMNLGLIKRIVLLTGTPIGNGLMDLWNQIYMIDKGERLYDGITQYRMRFFHNPEWKWVPVKGSEEVIYDKLKAIVISMKNEDYLNLPERIDTVVPITFGPDLQKRYDKFEKECVMAMGDVDITAFNSGALCTKLLQFASGAIYDAERKVHEIHDLKLEVLDEIIESAGGKPVLVFYEFQHSRDRILKRFKEAKLLEGDADVKAWNEKRIQVALMHTQSAYGINMQEGSNYAVSYDHTWSLEKKMQADARLWRQGQKEKVYFYRIVCKKTMDEDVIAAQDKKLKGQDALMEAVKARVEKYKKEVA